MQYLDNRKFLLHKELTWPETEENGSQYGSKEGDQNFVLISSLYHNAI